MGRLLSGALIILFVLVTNFLLAFITTGAATAGPSAGIDCGITGCSCGFCGITLGALPNDTEPVVGALYILVMGFLLVLGIALVIVSLIPTLSD